MFVPIRLEETEENVFSLIGQDWMLLTASKDDGSFNSMTASWGGLGILWGKPVCFVISGHSGIRMNSAKRERG